MNLQEWIARARDLGASDLHFEAGSTPAVRIRGRLQPMGEAPDEPEITKAAQDLLGLEGWATFAERGSADIALETGGVRCRINVFKTIRGVSFAVRLLTTNIRDLKSCNLHPGLRCLAEPTTGLVIISGPTGSGKSTTLAALIEEINGSRACNILSLESPLEYLFQSRQSLIRQREIPTHSPSFEQAIVDALRENPDVLVIGEMRTPEVMRLTLNAAETGHLVIATMHSATCAEALTRICMSFAPEIQGNIRGQLADCLVGVLCQRLDYLESHRLLVPRCELLFGSLAAKGTIRAGTFSHLANVIQSGGEDGMWSFDRYRRWMAQQQEWVRPDGSSTWGTTPVPRPADLRRHHRAARPPLAEIEIASDGPEELGQLAREIEGRIP